MKHLFKHLILVACLVFSWETKAQIPVTDGASIAASTVQHIQSFAQYVQQVQHLYTQIQNQVAQIKSLTGARNLGDFMNNPLLRQGLPADYTQAFDSLRDTGLLSSTPNAQNIMRRIGGDGGCSKNPNQGLCQAIAMSTPGNVDFLGGVLQRYQIRNAQLDALIQGLNNTQDMKSSSDLNGRINGEIASLIKDQTEVMAAFNMRQEQQKLNEQAARNAYMSTRGTSSTDWVNIK